MKVDVTGTSSLVSGGPGIRVGTPAQLRHLEAVDQAPVPLVWLEIIAFCSAPPRAMPSISGLATLSPGDDGRLTKPPDSYLRPG